MNRLGIYFLTNLDSIVDDYVLYYLKQLRSVCSHLCVIAQNSLDTVSEKRICAVCDKLLIQQDRGGELGAYRDVLLSYGLAFLADYDELILCSSEWYGPCYPLQEMFRKMALSSADWWGIVQCYHLNNSSFSTVSRAKPVSVYMVPGFWVIRHNMFSSQSFSQYWENLSKAYRAKPLATNYSIHFFNYFRHHGFTSDSYIPTETSRKISAILTDTAPMMLLNQRCPLVSRQAFVQPYQYYLYSDRAYQPRETLNYIAKYTNYDINLIWKHLLRTTPGSVLKRNLHLNFFLSESQFNGNIEILKQKKVALFCYIYFPDMVEYCAQRAANMPTWADLYIAVVDEKTKKAVEKAFAFLPNKVIVQIQPNRGQLTTMLLITFKKIFHQYDYVCVTHAKKGTHLHDEMMGKSFCDHCWDAILYSADYVLNVLNTFEKNPRLGITCAMPPHWGEYKGLIGKELTDNEENMRAILEKLYHITVPFDREPVASYGECYWVRTQAFKTLLSRNWKVEEMPKEPAPRDATVLHALERLKPMFAQYEGFYSAWVMPVHMASAYLDNIYFYFRQIQCSTDLKSHSLLNSLKYLSRLKWRYYRYKIADELTLHLVPKLGRKLRVFQTRLQVAREFEQLIHQQGSEFK